MSDHELIFLGTGNAFGHDGRRHSSYILRNKGPDPFTLLIDCGPSTLPALHQHNIVLSDLDFIYLSHLHPDHWLGLALLVLDNKWISKRENPIPLICPIGTQSLISQTCRLIYSEEEAEVVEKTFTFIEINDQSEIDLADDLNIRTLPAKHGGNGRMVIITTKNKTVGYSGDTAILEGSLLKIIKCDIAIHEASTYDLNIPNHTTLKELLQYSDKIHGQLFLSHVDSSISDHQDEITPPIFLAEDNLKIKF